ncbi:MMPL family protein [Novipirellula galeiformis]|uniref:MMPL family protein n=1 Tax=Novipirellula galeiformis TaxID=2528004 RepID=A0A5C6CJV5_9BACT|nr:MMPL family transporter [Novipirellula galeiformis]TWU24385.1 MMPL family protein [Novipirellula galeiformis]
MKQPLLERRSPLGVNYALLILMVFFFVLPSVFRAARLSLVDTQNEVKDWLPSDFPETAELDWFANHFVGESFVLATWPGCTSGDQRLQLLEQKLRHESDAYDPAAGRSEEVRQEYDRARTQGKDLQLLNTGRKHDNWGAEDEKWVRSASGEWYYITPDGKLYRWTEAMSGPAALIRAIKRATGHYKLEGQFVTSFGEASDDQATNAFYNDPSLICAPLFHTVETGDSIAGELASPGGALWPIDLTDESKRATVARRLALERLTGTLFANAVPFEFDWSVESFREEVPASRRDALPETFDVLVQTNLDRILAERFNGSLDELRAAPTTDQAEVWYAIYDALEVPPPPRLTCVLVTLTDIAKDNLPYVLGRGVAGGPRGRLLQLAEESGVRPPPAPSTAPPPFNKEEVDLVSGMPSLHLGGPPVDNTAIDEEGTITLIRLLGYSLIVGIGLSYVCFRSIKITTMIFVVGGSAAMLSMAMVWWTGGKVDAILMSMPSLVYVLGLAGAIHVVNYYRDEVRSNGEAGAAGRALRHAIVPCALASFTTAIGLGSLVISNLAPISNFGLYSAIGVLVTLIILFTYLPSALQTFAPDVDHDAKETNSPPHPQATGRNPQRNGSPEEESTEGRFAEWWAMVGRWITGHHALVSIVCLTVLLLGSIGLTKIKTSVQLLKLFDSGSRIIRDYAWLEDHFGKLVPMEMIVRVPTSALAENITDEPAKAMPPQRDGADEEPSQEFRIETQPLTILERAEMVARVSEVVRRTLGETGMDVVGQTMSADTFLPPLPPPSNSYDPVRSMTNRRLLDSHQQLLSSDYVRIEKEGPFAGSELWRISLRVGALSDVDYGRFIYTLRTAVEPVMRAYDTREVLLSALKRDAKGNPQKLSGKDRVVLVGHSRPESLNTAKLLIDAETIDTRSIYLSTLKELLANEKIRVGWIDPAAPDSKIEVGSPKWDQMVAATSALVWVGEEPANPQIRKSAKCWIDATLVENKRVAAALTPDRFPNVDGSGSLQTIYTGVIPVVYKAQRTLLYSLLESMAFAFFMIAIVMSLLLNPGRMPWSWARLPNLGNGIMAGAIAMIPNVFPVLLVFGVMCHLEIAIDIGTMMTASVAMGVAVDDTIHFLTWFRTNLDRGMSRVDAVIETYRRVGPAMTQTTVVGGLGLFIFALSTFTPTQRFGTLMLMMLATALVGDLILLPALLAGPAGRWFKPRTSGPEPTPNLNNDAGAKANIDPRHEPNLKHPINGTHPAEASNTTETHYKGDIENEHDDLPSLKIHFPPERIDRPHRMKRK